MGNYPNAIIIGGGAAGIAMAYKLSRIGFTDFTVYDKMEGIGGTWFANTYPGCGCDVPSQLYSFSFALNPEWSKPLCEQPEILAYMNKVVDDFDLRAFFQLRVECLKAEWIQSVQQWEVTLKQLDNGHIFKRQANIFISAVGGISFPRWIEIPGQDTFTGPQFHSARWDHTFDYTGKRLAIIGNGCSASQIVPKVVQKAAYVKQFTRSAQWIHERPNKDFTPFQKALFRYIPLYLRLVRFNLFNTFDNLLLTYGFGEKASQARAKAEADATKYVLENSPKKYHSILIPDFPLGCKRRVFDPDYLQSLWAKNLDVTTSKISQIEGNSIITADGTRTQVDAICYATGFKVTEFLTPMEVLGKNGIQLTEKWKESGGATAYKGVTVSGFPNFAILFGPNTFLAHNSAIFIVEVGVDYAIEHIVKPVLDNRATSINVKAEAEDRWATKTQQTLQKMVWSSGCSNWAVNEAGRNAASYPGTGRDLWFEMLKFDFKDYDFTGGGKFWIFNTIARNVRTTPVKTYVAILCLFAALNHLKTNGTLFGLRNARDMLSSVLARLGIAQ